MSKISCDVCIDLIMLDKDKAASDDSVKLIKDHIEYCKSCRSIYEEDRETLEKPINDTEILRKIRKKLMITTISLLVLGTLLGISLTYSMDMFYNFIIMPVIGGVGYIVLKNKWYFVNIFVVISSYIGILIKSIAEEGISFEVFYTNIYMSVVYCILSLLGVLIAFLLKYGLGKEE